jgi:hypothetical protein
MRIGPTVCEDAGPMPTVYKSKASRGKAGKRNASPL